MEMYHRKSPEAALIERSNFSGGKLFIKGTYFDAVDLKKSLEKEIER